VLICDVTVVSCGEVGAVFVLFLGAGGLLVMLFFCVYLVLE